MKKLSADARLLATIVESSNDAILSKTLDGEILSWNAAAERLFGYSADEAIGSSVTMIVPDDLLAEEAEILSRLRSGERIEHYETRRQNREGDQLDVSLTLSPLTDDEGRVVGVSNIARNITDQKRAQRALHESDERFRMLADNISQFAWMADSEGWIFWYNQRWYDYTGTTLEEMQGWGWRAVHHPDHIDRVVARVQHSWDTGEVWEDTFPLRGKDGQYRWFLSRAQPIRDGDGKIVRWFGTNTDITEQREAQEALKEADERKNAFLAMLAHELRNPLAPIRHGLDLIAMEGSADPNNLEVVQHQLEQLIRLVDDLLDVSRIMRDKVELRTTRVDLVKLAKRAANSVGNTLRVRAQSLVVRFPGEPVWVTADSVRLSQVIGNLLNNASKYSDHGSQVQLSLESDGAWVTLSVKDNGVGIEPQFLPHIFELFTQANRSIDRSQGGLGIGLTVVKQLVERHGGRVSVESEGLGNGSTFTIELPVSVAADDGDDEPASDNGAAAAVRPKKILLVDDNVGATWMLSKLLDKLGDHQVEVAHDGPTALAKAIQLRPDLAILDIGLPGMNGYELAKAIRSCDDCAGVFMVALTGYGQQDDRRRALDAGFDDHLVKPAGIDELERLLQSPEPMTPVGTASPAVE